MHPSFVEALATQRREQFLADAARSHRTKTMRASRQIRSPRIGWLRARLWLGSMSLALPANEWKAPMKRGISTMLDVVKSRVPG